AAVTQQPAGPPARHAPSGGARRDGGNRRGRRGRVGGDRQALGDRGRGHRDPRRSRRPAPAAAHFAGRSHRGRAGDLARVVAGRASGRASGRTAVVSAVMLAALTRNWELKLLAVALAVVVWFFVVNANRSRFGFAAPVEYVGLESGMVMLGTPRETIDVQVEAARWAAARLAP